MHKYTPEQKAKILKIVRSGRKQRVPKGGIVSLMLFAKPKARNDKKEVRMKIARRKLHEKTSVLVEPDTARGRQALELFIETQATEKSRRIIESVISQLRKEIA